MHLNEGVSVSIRVQMPSEVGTGPRIQQLESQTVLSLHVGTGS